MKIYELRTSDSVYERFDSLEKAKEELKKYAKERKYNLGVRHFKQDEMSFSFVLGWESDEVKFYILEQDIK